MTMKKSILILACMMVICSALSVSAQDALFSFEYQPMRIRFFVGGDAGDAFGSIVHRGAIDAANMLRPFGVEVEYVFSGWQPDQMISQLREAIASGVDAICMMGHPGVEAIMPLAEDARNAGVIMMYQNTDVAAVRREFGGGFAGVLNLTAQGERLGNRAIADLALQPGDRAVVFAPWGSPGRFFREEGVAKTFEGHGMTVERIQNPVGVNADPQLLLPLVTGQLQRYPETRIIVYSGGQLLAAAGMYMEANGIAPGEIYNIGFDLNSAVLEGFVNGYVQLSSDQQAYLQGFLPILNAFLTKNFEFAGLEIDTGANIIDVYNYDELRVLIEQGIR